MFNTIGILPPNIEIDQLIRTDTDTFVDSNSDDGILKEDTLIYATYNSEDEYYQIQFYIHNNVEKEIAENDPNKTNVDFFIHHDILVPNAISSSINIETLVGVGTMEGEIYFYDALEYNPIMPKVSFRENSPVYALFYDTKDKQIYSGGDDQILYKWDLNEKMAIEKKSLDFGIRSVNMINKQMVIASDKQVFFGDEVLYSCNDEIACLKVFNDFVYVGTDSGILAKIDVRNKAVVECKIFDDASLNDIDFIGGDVVVVNSNGIFKRIRGDKEIVAKKDLKDEIFAIKVMEEKNICFYGGLEKKEIGVLEFE